MHTNLTAREAREGKFLLRAPLLAVPLLTFVFWGLGGGRSDAFAGKVVHGFEMRIPPAHVASIVKLDKLEYYEAAKRDSAAERQKERMEDSYAKVLGLPDSSSVLEHAVEVKLEAVKRALGAGGAAAAATPGTVAARGTARAAARGWVAATRGYRAEAGSFGVPMDAGEMGGGATGAGAMGLARLRPGDGTSANRQLAVAGGSGMMSRAVQGPNMEKLERMMSLLQRDEGGNSEIAQLTAVLDRLAALQGVRQDTLQRKATVLTAPRAVVTIKALADADDTTRGFDSAAIEAIVPEEQVVVSGGELRLELVRDLLVGSLRVSAGTPIYGMVSLSGERLRVKINSIVWQDRVLPVSLQVDDEDGLAGIYIPGAPVTDAVRESTGSEVGTIGPTLLNTGVTGQAIDAGVSLGRQLIGKRIRPVRVTVPAGYRVLLHPQTVSL